jgi:ribosomal protein S6
LKKYETVIILDDRNINDDGSEFLTEIEKFLKEAFNGKIEKTENMGKKTFAREMKKRKTGIYLDIIHEMSPENVSELREKFRLDNRVLRLQTFTYDRPE